MWKYNVKTIEKVYGSYVNWEERFYICPECGEPVYEEDWDDEHLKYFLCPICEFEDDN